MEGLITEVQLEGHMLSPYFMGEHSQPVIKKKKGKKEKVGKIPVFVKSNDKFLAIVK